MLSPIILFFFEDKTQNLSVKDCLPSSWSSVPRLSSHVPPRPIFHEQASQDWWCTLEGPLWTWKGQNPTKFTHYYNHSLSSNSFHLLFPLLVLHNFYRQFFTLSIIVRSCDSHCKYIFMILKLLYCSLGRVKVSQSRQYPHGDLTSSNYFWFFYLY